METFNDCKFKIDKVVDANVADMDLKELIMDKSYCN